MSDITSRPYHPDPAQCCEACAFGRGEHAEWCSSRWVSGWISPGANRTVEIGKYTVTIENSSPVRWWMRPDGKIEFESLGDCFKLGAPLHGGLKLVSTE